MGYLDRESALAILNVAREGGYLEELPDSDEELIDLAQFYAKKAKEEYDTNGKMRKDPTIKAILALKSAAIDKKNEKAIDQYFGGILEFHQGLPIPSDPKEEATELPIDFTTLNDKEVRKLHAEYNSYLGRARWLLATATNSLARATHLRDDAYRKAYKHYNTELHLKEMKPTKDLVDSFAKEDEDYKTYDLDVRNEQEKVVIYKALVEIYGGNVDRLSREWTMRTDEERRY